MFYKNKINLKDELKMKIKFIINTSTERIKWESKKFDSINILKANNDQDARS